MALKYQGDPKITISPYSDGGINYEFGQPVMDTGLENAIIISLGTLPGWWGNLLMKKESQKIGSEYDNLTHDVLNSNQIKKIEDNAESTINWMKSVGIIEKAESVINNPEADRIENTIIVKKPGGIVEIYQINWDQQFQE